MGLRKLHPSGGGKAAILSQLGISKTITQSQPGGPCPSRMLRKAFKLAFD